MTPKASRRADPEEIARLAPLDASSVLDTPADPGFDDILRLAAQVCATPVALISLLDRDPQWVMVRAGLDLRPTASAQSFCTQPLSQTELLVIADLTTDARTRHDPLVTGPPHLRFFAGTRLETPEGVGLGTLCVADGTSRPAGLEPDQRTGLEALGRQVMRELALRRALVRRAAAEAAPPDAAVRQEGTIGVRRAARTGETARGARPGGDPTGAPDPQSNRPETVSADQAAHGTGVTRDIARQQHNETRQAALIELGDALRGLDRTRDIAWSAARIMGRVLGVDRVGYGTVDTVRQTIEILRDWTVPGMASIAGSHRFVAAGTLLEDLDGGRPVAVDDVAGLPTRAADAGTFAALGARAMLNVPILEHGRLVAIVFLHHRGPRPWNEEEIGFVRNAADRVRAAVARVGAEEEQRLVNRELGHRLKNTLTMVQAIASQTLRNASTLELAREALSARLVALGRAHDILLSGGDDRAPLRTLITGSLALTGDLEAERFTISGPDLVIGPKAALSVSLMIHELATNAVKYGALSRPEGRVDIFWSVDARSEPEMFHMGWSERGGPPVTVPARRGFGSRLIERGLAGAVGGAMALQYEPAGVRCTLDAPLGAMMAED